MEFGPCRGNPLVGITRGCGTRDDPYVIEGREIRFDGLANTGIRIFDTTKHLLIRNSSIHGWPNSAIYVENAKNIRIENSVIVNNGFGGIVAYSVDGLRLDTNFISRNRGSDAVFMTGVNITIQNNLIEDNDATGIFLLGLRSLVIERNTVRNHVATGIVVDNFPQNARIKANVIEGNAGGLAARIASGEVLDNNIFANQNFGLRYCVPPTINMTALHNWWGHSSGPSGVGNGTGQAIVSMGPSCGGVDFDPWRTTPNATAGSTLAPRSCQSVLIC